MRDASPSYDGPVCARVNPGTVGFQNVAVKDGRIAAIGAVSDKGNETIDGDGLVLSPGIVDVHTHYDAQVTWDATLSPSPSLSRAETASLSGIPLGQEPSPSSQAARSMF